MRFDLEIPGANVDIVYIPEESNIPTGIIPLDYVHMDHKDYLPGTFLSMEQNILIEDFAGQAADEHEGPRFIARGNRFNITHVAKYAPVQNTKVPLFLKHVIYNSTDDKINEDTIRVVDFYGDPLPDNKYLVEQVLNTDLNFYETTIYMNKEPGLWFVEYVSSNRIYKKLLNLERIFNEVGWETAVFTDEDIPPFMYVLQGNEMKTSYSGTMWIEYEHEKVPIQLPIANIRDNWYVSILNVEWSYFDVDQGISFDYSIPEYYFQNSSESSKFKIMKEKKCEVLFQNFIQTQAPIDMSRWDTIEVVVKNFYTGDTKAVFATSPEKIGSLYEPPGEEEAFVYQKLEDYNHDGVIRLPYNITEEDIAYATWPYIQNHYEFRFFNFNSDILNSGGHVAIYVLPNRGEFEFSVMYAMIGDRETSELKTIGLQGIVFETTQEYYDFIAANNAYHLGTMKVSAREEADIVNFTDVRTIGGVLKDKHAACQLTKDVILDDIINGDITIPTNDTVIGTVSARGLQGLGGLVTYADRVYSLTNDGYKYLINMHEVMARNLDLSTRLIMVIESTSKETKVY